MGCEVWFYHLERTGLDQALPELLEKTLGRGWRALVRSGDRNRIEHLDGWLWTYRPDSFLPHGRADEPQADRQPVLLSMTGENLNGAQALFLLDDAEPGALDAYARCLILFDGRDEGAVAAARGRWREVKAAGHEVAYWKQSEEGAWRKQA
ncbi:MAG: DNA polymerase III subunit chi [Caulobacteraceae bacterium]